MKIKRVLLILICVVIMLFSASKLSYALSPNPTIVYDGLTNDFNFFNVDNNDLFYNFKELVPGDTKEEIINIKVNNISEKRSLYLTVNYQNKRILDNINITVYADDNIILDNDSIKSDYIKLKTFDNSGKLKLKIKVEVPVFAGNELSDLSQSIRWDLFIENENGDKFKIPSTIDDSNIYTYVLIFIITFIALIFILILENKDRKGDNL